LFVTAWSSSSTIILITSAAGSGISSRYSVGDVQFQLLRPSSGTACLLIFIRSSPWQFLQQTEDIPVQPIISRRVALTIHISTSLHGLCNDTHYFNHIKNSYSIWSMNETLTWSLLCQKQSKNQVRKLRLNRNCSVKESKLWQAWTNEVIYGNIAFRSICRQTWESGTYHTGNLNSRFIWQWNCGRVWTFLNCWLPCLLTYLPSD